MYQIDITITPVGMTRVDLVTPNEEHQEAAKFLAFIRPHIKALHWLATEFQPLSHEVKADVQGGQYEN